MKNVSQVRRRHRREQFNGTWTEVDLRDLRTIFGNNPNTQVAEALNRSTASVRCKASRLGLTKTRKYFRTLFAK